jgi:hypothetical protein
MKHQLDFWPATNQEASYEQGPWESLSLEEQTETMARLARMIAQAVCPRLIAEMEENHHEPQPED